MSPPQMSGPGGIPEGPTQQSLKEIGSLMGQKRFEEPERASRRPHLGDQIAALDTGGTTEAESESLLLSIPTC